MRVLEIGSYAVPAYAGMILAEQGAEVVKWTNGRDPILSLARGEELWAWINHGKSVVDRHTRLLSGDWGDLFGESRPEIVLDNTRPETLARWGVEPAEIARREGVVWVSMESEVGGRSFDLLAQARSILEYCPWVPFWLGDTSGGLWLAFKALAMHAERRHGHYTLGQATCLQKLVEGELVVEVERDGRSIPWEVDPYRVEGSEAVVGYRGETYREPARGREWKLANLRHDSGRMRI